VQGHRNEQGGEHPDDCGEPQHRWGPFQPVDNKSALTSTDPANAGFPFGLKTNGADADLTTNFVSSINVTAGDTYTVGMACVDTSPHATDPSA
jgi:hypothetical protein